MQSQTPGWLAQAVAAFGVACQRNLAGPGDRAAAIRVRRRRPTRTADRRPDYSAPRPAATQLTLDPANLDS